jgi:radical SAM superfamily enzyme YgiQ (UPF0313 family)
MKIVVIASPYPLDEHPSPPLGMSYVAAAFESAGAEVMFIDYIVSQFTQEKLEYQLQKFQPDAVGISSVTMNFPQAVEIISAVKEIDPSIITIMGGPHITFDAENTLCKHPEIDLLVLGEGEKTIQELVPVLKNRSAWPDVNGLAFRQEGKTIITPTREFIHDLETLPSPARHLLPISKYLALGYPVSLITSRGCPNQCIFCQGRRMVGHQVRYRKALSVVNEIETLINYGFERINVADDLFLSNKERAQAVCREMIERKLNISWSAFSRVNTVDPQTLALMREAGCDTISFGIESGNQEMLKRIRKGITLKQARRAVDICKKVGITPHASFMIGLPGENYQTLKDTKEFAESLDILYGYHYLAPFPGTTIREEIDQYDLEILTDDWSLYDANRAIVRTSQLSPEDMEKFANDYEALFWTEWEEIKQRYHQGTATPEETLKVWGHDKTKLVFQMLTEDIIEDYGSLDIGEMETRSMTESSLLIEKVFQATHHDRDLIDKTLALYIQKGLLIPSRNEHQVIWSWAEKAKGVRL